MKKCLWCSGAIIFQTRITENDEDREYCLKCGRSSDYEREFKIKEFQMKNEKKFRNWKGY